MKYVYWLLIYVVASIAAQFMISTPIELFSVAGVAIWLPLSALTLVPLVDVLRSFTQHQAEKENKGFRRVAFEMLALTTLTSGFCVVFAGLPLPIFMGVLLAVTLGGAADILVFRRMGKFFASPVKRMAVSNACATLLGSGIVFLFAFTDLVFSNNPLAKSYFDASVGWIVQSTFIWASSLVIAVFANKIAK